MHTQSKYRAPALERGLEIIELLAFAPTPMNLTDICTRLNRKPTELFRVLQVLEKRHFIMRRDATRGYVLTDKIFHLANEQTSGPAIPASTITLMRELSDRVSQSCHLAVASVDEAVVIERIDPSGDVAFTVALGFRRHVAEMAAGIVLFAFQSRETRLHWLTRLAMPDDAKAAFVARADRARHSGYVEENSSFAPGITDLCAPILQRGCAIAAVTIPYVQTNAQELSCEQVVLELCKATYKMSEKADEA
jgi:DNA-binding IclR family transcriptional regulator